ncbi:hypothetical protein B0H16DRAFT_1506710 [Mycena metata]|uniref:F-box domain-containing protein n=1 Tax=Mycena metata TaxID=1033252 RepID=A0AAD7NV41_9AGAR|nr:hypothetical protein B0H16DRAFT_1506710 [Mycena metata]
MDSLATTLLSTNLPPTDLQRDSVRQLILNYQKDVLDLRSQYRGRTSPLDVMARREHALQSIAAWKVVLSPVRRLPFEILGEIFVFCVVPSLRSRSTSADDPREPPILMSHVCALWRNVALNTPRLWSDLIFLFSKSLPKRGTVPILEDLIHPSTPHALRTYIDSGAFSVSDAPDILQQLIAIPEFASRVQTLHLKMGTRHLEDLLYDPPPVFLHLETLRLDICIGRRQEFVGRILKFLDSPTLRRLTIRCTYWEDAFCISLAPHFPWAQLVNLDLDVELKAAELVRILTQCVNLRQCGLFSLPDHKPRRYFEICTLPTLETLVIKGWEHTYWLFEIFRFPNLTLLDLVLGKWPTEALQVTPTFTLTHLALHCTYDDTEDGLALVLRFLAQSPMIESLQLNDIHGIGLIEGLTYAPSDNPVLLPRLEILWISIASWGDAAETVLRDGGEGLVQMIESRLHPDLRPSCAPAFAELWEFGFKCWKPKFSVSVQERLANLEEDGVLTWWE